MATGVSDVLTNYMRWNDAIADWFFSEDKAGQPAFLSVDDTSLQQLAASAGFSVEDAVHDFVSAIRALAIPDQIMLGMYGYGDKWHNRPTKEPPRFIAGLGLCVLAATRMAADSERGVSASNYYRHLNELLGREPAAGKPEGFEHMPFVWECLDEWLRMWKGQRGVATARQMGPRFIGWPISQALVRRADARDFRSFRSLIDHGDLEQVDPEDLVPYLKWWLTQDGAASRLARLLHHKHDITTLTHVADQLLTFLPEWEERDGTTQVSGTRAQFHLSISGFHYSKATLQVAWRCPPDAEDEVEVVLPSGNTILLYPRGEWLGVTADSGWLHAPISLKFEGKTITCAASPPMVFALGDGYGRPGWWILRNSEVPLKEPCIIICPTTQSSKVRSDLKAAARPNWESYENLAWMPSGWVLFGNVVFEKEPGGILSNYHVRSNHPWRLSGGIRVGRQSWLVDCLPRLEASAELTFDITSIGGNVETRAKGGTDLNGLRLDPGSYLIRGETVRGRRLTVVEPTWPPVALGAARTHELECNWVKVHVNGAVVQSESPVPEPHFFPVGLRYFVLGPHIGDIEVLEGSWGPAGLRLWCGTFTPVWGVRVRSRKVVEVTPLVEAPPSPIPESAGNRSHRERWASLLVGGRNRLRGLTPDQQQTYHKYLKVARGVD